MDYYFIGVNEYLCSRGDDTQKDFINDNDLCLRCKILENNCKITKTLTFEIMEIVGNRGGYKIEIGNVKKALVDEKIQNGDEIQYCLDVFSCSIGNFDYAYLISSNLYLRIKLEDKYSKLIDKLDKITYSNDEEKKFVIDLLNNKINDLC